MSFKRIVRCMVYYSYRYVEILYSPHDEMGKIIFDCAVRSHTLEE